MRLLSLVALAALVTACDTGGPDLTDLRVDELSHDPAALVGSWDLVTVTSSGYMGAPQTVAVGEAERRSYVFSADGTVEVGRPGRSVESTTWAVEPPGHLQIGTLGMTFGIDGDRLYLDRRPMDGGLYEYARRSPVALTP